MSSYYNSHDIYAMTAESILTARRLRALRTVLCDDGAPQHLEVVALADLLIDVEEQADPYRAACGHAGVWDGHEFRCDLCEEGP